LLTEREHELSIAQATNREKAGIRYGIGDATNELVEPLVALPRAERQRLPAFVAEAGELEIDDLRKDAILIR
jgi:hypothetical protein